MASSRPAVGEQELISLQIRTLATGNHDVTVAPGVRGGRKGNGPEQHTMLVSSAAPLPRCLRVLAAVRCACALLFPVIVARPD